MSISANAFTDLTAAKAFLGLSAGDGQDSLLESLIEGVSAAGRAYLGRDPYPTDYAEWHDGDSQDTIVLRRWPVIQVQALSDDGDDVGEGGDDYHVYPEEGVIFLDSGTFTDQPRGAYVYYSAGLSPWPPADLRQAANEWVQAKYAARGESGRVTSESAGDWSASYEAGNTAAEDMPAGVKAALDRYKNWQPGGVK
jgi:hypothetical protein